MEFEDEDAACAWTILNQFGRRTWVLFTRAKLEPLVEAKPRLGNDPQRYPSTSSDPNHAVNLLS